ncbi:MAG: RraA family protein [Planctomycetes bacterium]|nr:RraA family protein [Planctomycetota bacterium]
MEKLTQDQLQEIKQFDGPTVCNALECFALTQKSEGFAMPRIFPRVMVNERLIGYAATAKVSARNPGGPDAGEKQMGYYAQVREMLKPTIAVIQDIDPQPIGSFWGEVQATTHLALGAVGTLTHGGVRDLDEAEKLGFHFFSTDLLISHAYIHVVEYGCGVEIAGLTINPGDLLFADKHGAVKIPHAAAPRLAAACRRIADAELPMLEPCRAAIQKGVMPTIEEIKVWRAGLAKARQAAVEEFSGR